MELTHNEARPQDKANGKSAGKFNSQTLLLLVVNGLFITANALSGTFLGVYIWKASGNYLLLGLFTLLSHVCMGLTFWIAGSFVKKGRTLFCLRFGIAVSAAFYGIVLLLGTSAVHYIALLGVVQGLATGAFWLAFNVVYFEATDSRNRDRFNGWVGVTGSVVGMIAPWTAGYLISHMAGGERGYRIMFMISLGIFAVGVVVSFWLRNRRTTGDYAWSLPARIAGKPHTPWRPVLGALIAQGFRESVFGVMIGLLVYIQTGSEMKLGNFALITSVVGFVSFYVIGKWLKPAWRKSGMLIGTIVMTLAILPLFAGLSLTTLLIFGIGTALFIPLYTIPMTSSVFDLIGKDERSARQRVEYIVTRELALNVGRIGGMSVFILALSISKHPLVISAVLLVVGSSPIIGWLFMRRQLAARV